MTPPEVSTSGRCDSSDAKNPSNSKNSSNIKSSFVAMTSLKAHRKGLT